MTKTPKLQKLLLALLFIFASCLCIQGQSLQWAAGFPNSEATGITSDSAGNSYLTGTFNAMTDFDPGPGTAISYTYGLRDIYVIKIGPTGNLIWLRTVGNTGFNISAAIKVDPLGNVFIAGRMTDGLYFGNVGINTPAEEVFLWKLDPAGNTLWVQGFSSTDQTYLEDMEVAPNGDVYLTGWYKGTIDLDPGTGSDSSLSLAASTFLVKLDNAGNYLDGQTFGGSSSNRATALEVDAFGVYIIGKFNGDMYANANVILSGNPTGAADLFAIKLNHAGSLLWANNLDGGNPSYANDVLELETDGSGNVIMSGYFRGSLDCDASPGGTAIMTSAVDYNAFLIKWDSNGQYLNSGMIRNNLANSYSNSMEVDAQGNIYLNFTLLNPEGFIDIELGPNEHLVGSLLENGSIIVKYAPNFSILWIGEHFSAVPSYTNVHRGVDTHLAPDGSLLVTGEAPYGIDLDPENSTLLLTSNISLSAKNVFAYRMKCSSSHSYSYYSACDSVSILGQTFTQSGLHHFRIPDGQGCDSVVTVQVDVLAPFITEIQPYARLITEPIDQAQYQWLYCDSNYAQVPNQNNYFMDVGPVGNYAVAVTLQGCTDTSACYMAVFSPVQDPFADLQIAQLPEGFRLLLPGTFSASLIDLQGRVLATSEAEDACTFEMSSHPAGVYLVRLQTDAGVASRKVVWMGH